MIEIYAPIQGTVQSIFHDNRSHVEAGERVGTIDLMKLETEVVAPCAGAIVWRVDVGQYVDEGDYIAHIEEDK